MGSGAFPTWKGRQTPLNQCLICQRFPLSNFRIHSTKLWCDVQGESSCSTAFSRIILDLCRIHSTFPRWGCYCLGPFPPRSLLASLVLRTIWLLIRHLHFLAFSTCWQILLSRRSNEVSHVHTFSLDTCHALWPRGRIESDWSSVFQQDSHLLENVRLMAHWKSVLKELDGIREVVNIYEANGRRKQKVQQATLSKLSDIQVELMKVLDLNREKTQF